MKNTLKKFMAISLAIIMVMSCTIASLAAGGEAHSNLVDLGTNTKGTITITGVDPGDTFDAYQVMSVKFDSTTNGLKYELTPEFTEFLDSSINKTGVKNLENYQALKDQTKIAEILGLFVSYCVQNNKDKAFPQLKAEGAAGAATATKTGVDLGQYVFYGASPSMEGKNVFSLMTASFPVEQDASGKYKVNTTVTITAKKTTPTIEKKVNDDQVGYGDEVVYTLESTVPHYPEKAKNTTYIVGDKLGTGLTFDGATKKLEIKGVRTNVTPPAQGEETLIEDTHYTITKPFTTDNSTRFEIKFIYDAIKSFETIRLTYGAIVTKEAELVTGANNTAELTYSHDPFAEKDATHNPNTTKTVYPYGLEVNKVDKETGKPVEGEVEFKLFYEDGTTPVKFDLNATDGIYRVNKAGTVEKITTKNGKITIHGLDVGTYILTETKAAAGYELPKNPSTTIVIKDDDKDGKIDGTDSAIHNETVENKPLDSSLPETGGIGTYIFLAIGICGMGIALIAFARLRKKEHQAD